MINEDFVTYDQAVQLKELGFDWECNHWYHPLEHEKIIECQTYCNHNSFERPFSAPTLAQVQKWFLEQKKIYIEIYAGDYLNHFGYELKFDWADNHRYCAQGYRTPKEALLAGIDDAIKFITNQIN